MDLEKYIKKSSQLIVLKKCGLEMVKFIEKYITTYDKLSIVRRNGIGTSVLCIKNQQKNIFTLKVIYFLILKRIVSKNNESLFK